LGATIARGALWSFAINALAMALGFFVQLLLVRTLHQEQYGLYLYVLAAVNIAVLVAKLEFDPCAIRYVGAYAGTREWALLRGFLRRSHEIVGGTTLVVAVATVIGTWVLRGVIGTERVGAYYLGCALIPVTALLWLQAGCLQGFKEVRRALSPNLLVRPLLVGLTVLVLAHGLGTRLNAAGALAIQFGATSAALVLSSALLRWSMTEPIARATPYYATAEWMRTAASMVIIAGANLVLSAQSDVLIVGTYLGTAQAGVYGVANQFATLIGFGVTGVLFITTPLISSLYAQRRLGDLQRLVTIATRLNLAISLPVVPLIAIFGKVALGWFGPGFVAGYPVLLVLSVGVVVAASVGALSGFIMTMTGLQHEASFVIGGSAVLNLALSLVLTPRFGVIGTACATAIAGVVRAVVLAVRVKSRRGIVVTPFSGYRTAVAART